MSILNKIKDAGKWSKKKEVMTKFGRKCVQTSPATYDLSQLYKQYKDEMKEVGFSYTKDREGNWSCALWSDITKEREEEIAEAVEASKAADADIVIPTPEGLDFYPFQKAGIAYMKSRKGILLADQMGLGKTPQSLGFINMHGIKNVIIVCPKSLVLNWKKEAERWLTDKTITIGIVTKQFPDTDIVILNYDVLKKWKDDIASRNWELSILDEAHYIKNGKSQRSKLAKAIDSKYKIRITGTPIVNRPIELYNIIEDLSPEFNSFWSFAKRYCGATKTRYGWDMTGATNLSELQERLRASIMVRRLKEDVLKELPAKMRQVVEITADGKTSKQIKKESSRYAEIEEKKAELRKKVQMAKMGTKEKYDAAVTELEEFGQAAFTEIAKLRHETALLKVFSVCDMVKDVLSENEDKKVIVAALHQDVIMEYVTQMSEYNPVYIHGGVTSNDKRQQAVDTFQNDKNCRVFVASIQAAGTGITLTASDWVVFSELDWVPGNMSQMEDRAHRIGQTSQVLVQHLVLENSIDSMLAKTLVSKQNIIDKALDKDIEISYEDTDTEIKSIVSGMSFNKIEEEFKKKDYTNEQKEELMEQIRTIASYDQDHAATINGVGFNSYDTEIGHSLAKQSHLTNKQAYIAEKLVKKYKKQIEMFQ